MPANSPSDNKPSKDTPHGPSSFDLTQQVTDLQITVAYLEDTLERLDTVVAAQDKQLQDMQRQLKLLYGQISQKGEQTIAPFDVVADRPPHY